MSKEVVAIVLAMITMLSWMIPSHNHHHCRRRRKCYDHSTLHDSMHLHLNCCHHCHYHKCCRVSAAPVIIGMLRSLRFLALMLTDVTIISATSNVQLTYHCLGNIVCLQLSESLLMELALLLDMWQMVIVRSNSLVVVAVAVA